MISRTCTGIRYSCSVYILLFIAVIPLLITKAFAQLLTDPELPRIFLDTSYLPPAGTS